jgi:glycosyl transferase family 25
MKTYVINLPRATARRSFMEAQLASSGLDWEFVDGVDGYQMSATERAELVDEDTVSRFPAWLTPGMIGCVLSHQRVYELITEAGDGPALVLEDDAMLPPDLASLVAEMTPQVPPDGLVLLDFRSFRPCRLSRSEEIRVAGHALLSPIDPRQPVSSLAYLVGERAAANMAKVLLPVRWGPDSWGEYVEAEAIGWLRCALPRPVRPSPFVRSMTRHSEVSSLRDRMLESWPIQIFRQINRRRIAWLMYRVEVVDQP